MLRQFNKDPISDSHKEFVSEVFFEIENALKWGPQAAFICNPAPLHIKTALDFAQHGIHLFIEKPLSVATSDIDLLISTCESNNIVLMVGYVLRFLEPLKIIKEALDKGKIGKILLCWSVQFDGYI